MFHFTDDKITSILNTRTNDDFTYFAQVASRFANEYKPLFFTPYRSCKEFGLELIAPIENPLRLAGISGAAAMFAVLAAAASVAALLIGSTAALFMQTKVKEGAFNFASTALIVLGSALITAATSFVLAIASLPYALFSLASRSITSLTTSETEKKGQDSVELTEFPTSPSCRI